MDTQEFIEEVTTKTIVEGCAMMGGATLRVRPSKDTPVIVYLSLYNCEREDKMYYFNKNTLSRLIEHLEEIHEVMEE